jgi:Ataxin-3
MLATSLDQLEAEHDHQRAGQPSSNQDDTGFFSVQVIESALDAFGLKYVLDQINIDISY